jgi:hypothetical protein
MQPVTLQARAPVAALSAAALAAAFFLAPRGLEAAGPPCPWIVQPQASMAHLRPADEPGQAFDIVLDGVSPGALYGFSVSSPELAWKLTAQGGLPDLERDGRPLEPVVMPLGQVAYRLAPDTVEPATIYLVAAPAPIAALEQLEARIEPSRPLTQMALRTRGASDQTGPLPHMRIQGQPVAMAQAATGAESVQICAYQVAMR